MTRPMAVIGFSFFITLAFLNLVYERGSPVIFAVCMVLFVISCAFKRIRRVSAAPTALLSAAVACLLFFLFTSFSYSPVVNLAGENVAVSAKIISIPAAAEEGKYRYLLKTDSVGGKNVNVRIRYTTSKQLDVDYYDNVSFSGCVYVLGGENEEYHRHYKSQKTYLGAYTFTGVSVTGAESRPPYYYVLRIKQNILGLISELLPGDSGGLLAALLFGDKSLLSDESLEALRRSGVSHLIAVSGLHLSIWALAVFKALEWLHFDRRVCAAVSGVIVLCVMAFSAFSVSVMRAGLTLLLYLTGVLISRKSEGFNSLGFAALSLMIFNPYIVCDVSFLMTVLAAAGVLTCSKYVLPKVVKKVRALAPARASAACEYLCSMAALSAFAQAFTAPATILFFGTFCPYALVTNLLVSLPAALCMFGAGLLPILSLLTFSRAGGVFALEGMSSYILRVASAVANAPGAVLRADYAYVYVWLVISIAGIGLALLASKKRAAAIGVTLCLSIALLSVSSAVYASMERKRVRVTALDVGNGMAVLVSHAGSGFLIGCGGSYFTPNVIEAALDRENVSLECIVLPGASGYETSAIKEVLAENRGVKVIVDAHGRLADTPAFTPLEKIDLTFWECVDIRQDKGGYLIVDIYDTRLVISLFYKSALARALPELSAHAVIARQGLPRGVSAESFAAAVIIGDCDEDAAPGVYFTGRDSNVTLLIKQDGFSVRRYH